jgi:tryptophan synthase alpha chain
MLETLLRERMAEKEILLMTHIVLGYPSLEDSFEIIKAMVEAGVDIMELQIPFSEPIADGPVILHANQKSLKKGTTVKQCVDFGRRVAGEFDIPFLFMTYYNILFKYGVDRFVQAMADNGLQGSIVPDLPPEEGQDYLAAMEKRNLSPIFIYSPTTPIERMRYLSSFGRGFMYCVARKGVTGQETAFSEQLGSYLEQCRNATDLPLALGFGVKDRDDVEFLRGKADIAVIGSQTIRLIDEQGVDSVGPFIRSLR